MKRGKTYTMSEKRKQADRAKKKSPAELAKRDKEIAAIKGSLREVAKILGVSHETVRASVKRIKAQRSLDKIAN